MRKARLYIDIEYDPKKTDAESVANALDHVLDAARSLGLMDLEEYGDPRVKAFFVLEDNR